MIMTKQTISVQLSQTKKQKPDPNRLEFGRVFTDHMFVMDYSAENGWHDPRIVPYQPIEMDPAAMVYHYGQSVFEGLKAYVSDDGKVLLFRPEKNVERLNKSNDRLCIPRVDPDTVLDGLKQLLQIEKEGFRPQKEHRYISGHSLFQRSLTSVSLHPRHINC